MRYIKGCVKGILCVVVLLLALYFFVRFACVNTGNGFLDAGALLLGWATIAAIPFLCSAIIMYGLRRKKWIYWCDACKQKFRERQLSLGFSDVCPKCNGKLWRSLA